jgi:hypothetical protein
MRASRSAHPAYIYPLGVPQVGSLARVSDRHDDIPSPPGVAVEFVDWFPTLCPLGVSQVGSLVRSRSSLCFQLSAPSSPTWLPPWLAPGGTGAHSVCAGSAGAPGRITVSSGTTALGGLLSCPGVRAIVATGRAAVPAPGPMDPDRVQYSHKPVEVAQRFYVRFT